MKIRAMALVLLVALSTAACAPSLPADHEGRTECLVCHLEGADEAPAVPPDHRELSDGPTVCGECHKAGY